jgi:putative sigma-54 modulation protein
MHTEVRGVHVDVTQKMQDLIDRELQKLEFAKDMIIDLILTVGREKSSYKLEVTLNFRWGTTAHIGTDSFDFNEAVDTLFDKIETKVIKEKEKVQQH